MRLASVVDSRGLGRCLTWFAAGQVVEGLVERSECLLGRVEVVSVPLVVEVGNGGSVVDFCW